MILSEITPPAGLLEAVLLRVARARRCAARVEFAVFGGLSFLSGALVVVTLQYAINDFATSGFGEYLALFFDSVARGYTTELLYSLTASLPSIALLLVVATASAALWSLDQTGSRARLAFARVSLSA